MFKKPMHIGAISQIVLRVKWNPAARSKDRLKTLDKEKDLKWMDPWRPEHRIT
jgi:hypothetical protein